MLQYQENVIKINKVKLFREICDRSIYSILQWETLSSYKYIPLDLSGVILFKYFIITIPDPPAKPLPISPPPPPPPVLFIPTVPVSLLNLEPFPPPPFPPIP